MCDVKMILIVLIVSTILTSGCINPGSFGAAPVEVPTTKTVIETQIVTPIPAPTVAPTAVIGKVPVATPAPIPAVVSTTSDHVSKYLDNKPVPAAPMGTALIIAGGLDTYAAVHINSTDDNKTVNLIVNITPDGNSARILLVPGNYNAVLPDRYDNQTEQNNFFIGADSVTYVSFSGYSYRTSSGGRC